VKREDGRDKQISVVNGGKNLGEERFPAGRGAENPLLNETQEGGKTSGSLDAPGRVDKKASTAANGVGPRS